MVIKKIAVPVILLVLIVGYFAYSATADSKPIPKSLEEEITIVEGAINKANESNVKDPGLKKWVMRMIVESKTYNVDLTLGEVIQKAKETKNENEAFINYAKEHYGIKFTEEELDKYIVEHIDIYDSELKNKQMIAELHGITTYELNHEYDRDLNTRNMVWEMVKPLVDEKYSISSSLEKGEQVNINNLLLEKYNEEVENFVGNK